MRVHDVCACVVLFHACAWCVVHACGGVGGYVGDMHCGENVMR
jgi:hypothetical protein